MKKPLTGLILLMLMGVAVGCSSLSKPDSLSSQQLRKENAELKAQLETAKNKLLDTSQKAEDKAKRKEFLQQFEELYHQPLEKGNNQPGFDQAYINNLKTKLDGSYSTDDALGGIATIKSYLNSFTKLTQESRSFLSADQLNVIDNTDGETQTLGFTNVPLVIEGALRDQSYLIKKMDFALALKNYELGEIEQAEVIKKADAYQRAKDDYEKFIQKAHFAD